jgi:acetoin utilization protein AcuB
MKTSALMIPDPITIRLSASIAEAIDKMKANSIRHLPVVTGDNRLCGLVTLADLKQGLIPSMVSDLNLSDLMIQNPISVSPDDDIEIAAQLIYKHKISGMPVIKGHQLVGIITETDILRAFIDMMGLLTASARVDVVVGDAPEAFQRALRIINDNGGDVINVGMTTQATRERVYYFRLAPCKTAGIKTALETEGFSVLATMD